MQRKLILTDYREIDYTLKRSARAKKMRITVNCDASVVVTLPNLASEIFADKFLKEKFNWIFKKVEHFKKNSAAPTIKLTKKDYLENKNKARKLIEDRVYYFNKLYNFKFNKISIRNQKTRWGSCSKKRNLNFNYRMMYLPENLRDYIIIHELCHLKEFNHSKRFWNLVGEIIPNYGQLRKELRKTIF